MVNADADHIADVILLPILFGCLMLVQSGWDFLGQPCFTDVVAAFHSTIRQLCIGHLHADESVAALLRRFGLDAADFYDVCTELTGPTEFQSAGMRH